MKTVDKFEAIKMAGNLLVDNGYVEEKYIEAMIQREKDLSTYIGQGIAIPHGVNAAKDKVKKSGIVVLQFPQGIDFGEGIAYLVIGIAGRGNEHLAIISGLAEAMLDENGASMELLKTTKDVDCIYKALLNNA